MNDFELRVLKVIKDYNLICNGDKVVVGFSGGPDSTALLNSLYNIREYEKSNEKEKVFYKNSQLTKDVLQNIPQFEIVCAHINHGIRENATLDEEFCKNYCAERDIPLFVLHSDVVKLSKEQKRGLEEVGRNVRYNYFKEIAKQENCNKIAIAHNSKDKTETIIMNILRGTGISGLKGILEISTDNEQNVDYIRPILHESRENIEEYLKSQNITPRIDESNFDNNYTRNKIRNVVIPYIEKEFNPSIIDSLNRLGNLAKEESDYIKKLGIEGYNKCIISQDLEKIELDFDIFNSQDEIIKKQILLYSIEILFGSIQGIEQIHVEDILNLCSKNIGNKQLMPNKHLKIVIKNKKILINCVK